jgi:UDP-N-acetylglucosamine 2-epimerase (non-hydrolysing)
MLTIVLGTRPEIIKTAPIIFEAQRRNIPVGIIHTGQHYSAELDGIFFQELRLPEPVVNLHIGSHPAARQIGLMMDKLTDAFAQYRPTSVLVQGDTNSVLAGALAADKNGIPVAHLEAGLRNYDWSMPEEANRVLSDRLSTWLFCPTDIQRRQVSLEGIDPARVHVVGNSVVDAVTHFREEAERRSKIMDELQLRHQPYALLTLHRPNNVDDPKKLQTLLNHIAQATQEQNISVIFPIHPRTQEIAQRHGVTVPSHIRVIKPLGYLDTLALQMHAALVLTDSGGIQEEACVLQVPSVTIRPNTERPETVEVGASVLCEGLDLEVLRSVMAERLAHGRNWPNPFGDGKTAERVITILNAS